MIYAMILLAAIDGFDVMNGDVVRFVEHPSQGRASARLIPGGDVRSNMITRLVWPGSALAMSGTIDGAYRRALAASLFGLPGWYAELPGGGPLRFDLDFLKDPEKRERLLPPCSSSYCIYNHTNLVYTNEGKRITARYINNLNHLLFKNCDNRGIAAFKTDPQAMGFGRTTGYSFVGQDITLGGHGSAGVLGWTASDLPDVRLHGEDVAWSLRLSGVQDCVGKRSPDGANFWEKFLVPLCEIFGESRSDAIRNAFVNDRMAPFVYAGKIGTDDYAGFVGHFTTARRVYDFNGQLRRVTEGQASPTVEQTKRLDYGEWAHANGFERLCDTVIVGPDVMPRPAYGSSRQVGSKYYAAYFAGTNHLYWSSSDGKYVADGAVQLEKVNEVETDSVRTTVTNVTSRVHVTALYCPDCPNFNVTVSGGSNGWFTVSTNALELMGAEAVRWRPGAGRVYITQFGYFESPEPCIRFTIQKDRLDFNYSMPVQMLPLCVDLSVGAVFDFTMARVTSARRVLDYTGYTWPEKQTVGFYPHKVLSEEMWNDVGKIDQKGFYYTYMCGAHSATNATSLNVAGEDAIVQHDYWTWKLAGGEYMYWAGNYPTFAIPVYNDVEGQAAMLANLKANIDIGNSNFTNVVKTLIGKQEKLWMARMAQNATTGMTAKVSLADARYFRFNVDEKGAVDFSSVESAVTKWEPESVPINLAMHVDIQTIPLEEDRLPAGSIPYKSATGVGSCFGVGAVRWKFQRIDRP